MKILVTGGAGFIGSTIVDLFIQEGHNVAVVDDLSTGHLKNLNPQARFYELDIRSPQLAEVFRSEKPEVVCHQAAKANVRESFELPLLYADVNVLGSLNILECCRTNRTRKVIYASTGGAVYGEPETLPVDELHPINPLDPYGASKHHVEHYLHLYHVNFGLDYTVLRYPNVFGPRQDPYGEAGVIAIFSVQMLKRDPVIINGSGEQERDFVHVSDVAQANLLALSKGGGKILNIGSGKGISINDIARMLSNLTEYQGKIQHGPAKPGEVFKIFLDSVEARNSLGWEAKIPMEVGLSGTVDFFRRQMEP